eukprot:jgi/Orpsp1_1/1184068/evm.model.c7180000087875.1
MTLENDYITFNTTTLIYSYKSSHILDNTTIQNIYLIFSKQLNEFRNYFNNAKFAVRNDYPELCFIDWEALDIDYTQNGKLILVHKEEIIIEKIIKDPINNETVTSNEIQYKKSYKYIYKGLTENIKAEHNLETINNLLSEQTEFIYYKIIKNAFVDVPVVSTSDYYWGVSSLNYGINTIINNIIDNIYKYVKYFDNDNITYGKNNITESLYIDRNANEVYGLFKSGYATSINLAKTFKLAMNYIGINCVLVWGTTTNNVIKNNSNSNEMWNAINLFDEWYSIDIAFNYYNICMVDNSIKKRDLNVDCATEKWNQKSNDDEDVIDLTPYTLFGSEYTSQYLKENCSILTSEDTYFIFPKLSEQNYVLIMNPRLFNENYNITVLTDVDKISLNKLYNHANNINNINSKQDILDNNIE